MDAYAAIEALQQPIQLTILDLSHPMLHPQSPNKRRSSASDSSNLSKTSPSLLAADLSHYRDLFSKLRFSYVEAVTKEKFLRSIVSDPPEFVDAEQNVELEEQLRGDKAALKEKKEEVRSLIQELEDQARMLARRYEDIQLRTAQLESLPTEIEELQSTIAALQAQEPAKSSNPDLSMPLQPTLSLLTQREQDLTDINEQIAALQASLPQKRHEVEQLQDELAPLQLRKIRAVQEAQEARRRRGDDGYSDELEEKGRWLRGVESGLKTMLEV